MAAPIDSNARDKIVVAVYAALDAIVTGATYNTTPAVQYSDPEEPDSDTDNVLSLTVGPEQLERRGYDGAGGFQYEATLHFEIEGSVLASTTKRLTMKKINALLQDARTALCGMRAALTTAIGAAPTGFGLEDAESDEGILWINGGRAQFSQGFFVTYKDDGTW